MSTLRQKLTVISIAIVALLALAPAGPQAQSAKSSLEDPAKAALFNSISDKLVCQCGCNMILRVCNHFECPSAIPMRAQIEEQILAGMSSEAIVAGFVDEYGMVVLASPPPEGINLAAWVMPGFAILIGLFLVLYLLSGWLAKKKAKPAPGAASIDAKVMSRIEEELGGLER